jgi:hypothetical protein
MNASEKLPPIDSYPQSAYRAAPFIPVFRYRQPGFVVAGGYSILGATHVK